MGCPPIIYSAPIQDVRFPTSRRQHGSDAMNPDPDYSAAYVTLHTDGPHCGQGLVFTLGRGTELCAAAVQALGGLLVGRDLATLVGDFGAFWRELTSDSQLRWLGPEKGIVHLATAALVNALWDLWAKIEGKPLWQLVCGLSPEELVRCIDFRYLTDALTPEEALQILRDRWPTRDQRRAEIERLGYPAYTTSAGWLGYSDRASAAALPSGRAGWLAGLQGQSGRRSAARSPARCSSCVKKSAQAGTLMLDANQIWDVDEAIRRIRDLARFDPLWIEEPTSPDDVLGHARIAQAIQPIGVASGEAAPNRVIFKQLLQAEAIRFCQIDSCRLGGVNEVLAVLLMAAKFGVPVCPHGGGVGLCEHIQHLALIDYICISGSLELPFCGVRRPPARTLPASGRDPPGALPSARPPPATAWRCNRPPSDDTATRTAPWRWTRNRLT